MAIKNDFLIDRRVSIAMDALTARQRAALEPALRSKADFLAQASAPGRSQSLANSKHLYKMRIGQGLRLFYSMSGDDIVVLDVMRKAMMDRLMSRKVKGSPLKESRSETLVNPEDR